MTRALLVAPSSVAGGSQRVLAALARHLPAAGVEVRAVALQRGPLEGWLADAGCPTDVIDAGRVRHFGRTGAVVRDLADRAAAADVVVSNETKGHIYGGLAAARARVPAVWWQHGCPGANRIDLAAALVPARSIVCYTPGVAAAQRRMAPGREVVVIPGGIPVADVAARAGSGAAVRARYGWGEAPVVGIVGRLQAWKRQDLFLRAAALVARRVPAAHFAVVGGPTFPHDAAYARSLPPLAESLGIAGRTSFVGHQDDPYPWFDALDVVVHASDDEPFGLVVLEAMALATPVVAPGAGGPAEIVEDGRSGMLVPPGDTAAMADAVVAVLTDPALRQALRDGGRRRVREFTEEKMAERLAAVIDRATGGTSGRPPAAGRAEWASPGLHAHVAGEAVRRVPPPARALDLGAGSGALAERLRTSGFHILACDRDRDGYCGSVPFQEVDLDEPRFADTLGLRSFDLVTAVEVIEHLESPASFLRNLERLLAPGGVAIVTTPNVESLASRARFAVAGELRAFDARHNPGHVSPVFWSLLLRHLLPRAGLQLDDHTLYPPRGHRIGRPAYGRVINAVGPILARRDPRLVGDSHVLVLRPRALLGARARVG